MGQTINIIIQFSSFWHVGAGRSTGMDKDAIVRKDSNNLPILPGRTIKGLLKDQLPILSYASIDVIPSDFYQKIFGEGEDKEHGRASQVHFTSGRIIEANNIPAIYVPLLYTRRSSTRIEDNGLAKNSSLRVKELTIPITLVATIYNFPSGDVYLRTLKQLCGLVKKAGLNRNRGLGRCDWRVQE